MKLVASVIYIFIEISFVLQTILVIMKMIQDIFTIMLILNLVILSHLLTGCLLTLWQIYLIPNMTVASKMDLMVAQNITFIVVN